MRALGAKTTATVQSSPAASVLPEHWSSAIDQLAASRPVSAAAPLGSATATLPAFSTVKVKGALLLSVRRSPKSCESGSISSAGVMPLPLSVTVRGEPGASSTSLSDALAAPSLVGE